MNEPFALSDPELGAALHTAVEMVAFGDNEAVVTRRLQEDYGLTERDAHRIANIAGTVWEDLSLP